MEGLELHKAKEEAAALVGARLAKVHQVGDLFFLRFFNPPGALVMDPLGKAFHRTELRPPAPPRPPSFCQLLRTLEGQPLLALEQAGFDRVLRLSFPEADLVLDLRPRLGNLFFFPKTGKPAALREGEFKPANFEPGDPLLGVGPELRKVLAAKLGRAPNEEELRSFAEELLHLPPRGFLWRKDGELWATFFPRPDWGEPLKEFPTFWEALDWVREERLFKVLAKARIEELERELARKKRALEALAAAEKEAQAWVSLKEKADLILARLSEIPKGAAKAVVEGFDGNPVEIDLDPSLPPALYAQTLYKKAQKLRRTAEEVPKRRTALLAEMEKISEEIQLFRERPDLVPYFAEEAEKENREEPPSQPRSFRIGDFTVLVGRSAKENEEILRRASPNDIWLHARGVPGAHVLIKNGGRIVPEEVLLRAAELAAWFSKARGARKVEVSYTEARYLRKPKGSPAGMVALLREKVLVVSGEEGP